MPYNHFDYVPSSVSHNRSVFKFEKAVSTGGEIGYLYPICAPVRMFPGSSLSLDIGAEVRSGSLIAPLQDALIFDCFAFKVPNRIVWEHWKQFMGAVDDVLFDNLTEYKIPSFNYGGSIGINVSGKEAYYTSHLLATCYELPYVEAPDTQSLTNKINALPFRGYTFIWNEFFRPEQLVDPILFSKTDDGASGQNMEVTTVSINFNGSSLDVVAPGLNSPSGNAQIAGGCVLPTFRVHKSLWSSCLPKPSLETLNLLGGLTAPVGIVSPNTFTPSSSISFGVSSGTSVVKDDVTQITNLNYQAAGEFNGARGVIADLNQALLTVNNYRETIMLQNYYDALNRAGSRYDELLRTLFHTNSPEAVIDIPELIVHKRFVIYRKEVVATATTNYGDSKVQTLGSQGSYIDTVVKDDFFTTSCTEHSYVHMLWTIRPYIIRMGNGIEPKWTQLDKFDQYYPQFDGMGDVPRYDHEIFVSTDLNYGINTRASAIFGYQEYGAEDKYQRNSAVGWMNPNVPGHIAGFTLTEVLSLTPSLVPSERAGIGSYISCIVEEEAFARCLAISDPTLAPQFIVDFRLSGTIVHPMPVYNIPGMGDLL